jgi:Protein of unknown function (DUF3037)
LTDRQRCEFSLIRYVPDPVKNEFVNIGVLLRSEDARAAVRFTRDWSRVRCVDPDADTTMLEALEAEIGRRLALDARAGVASLEDALSNAVQLTEAKACLAESFATELEGLMQLYVLTAKRRRESRRTGRGALQARMRTEFERAGVWELMQRRISAARYTRAGDPLRIDCGYRPNGVVRMFQAVSLAGDVEGAKVLAFSSADLAEGIARVEHATLELTAIVEPLREVAGEEIEEEQASYRFGVETMEREHIRVLTTSDLGRVAETARRELRV